MKILVYGISNEISGISEFMMNVNSEIKDKFIFDYIIKGKNSYYEKKIMELGGEVYYYNYNNAISRVVNIYKIMKKARNKHDIFYYNTSGIYFIFPLIFAKMLKYKIISHAHNSKQNDLNIIYTLFNKINRKFVIKNSKLRLQCSDLAGDWVFGKRASRIQINNAIDLEKYRFNANTRKKYRTMLNLRKKDIAIINVARLEKSKNQIFLLECLKKAINNNKNLKLYIVGEGNEYKIMDDFISANKLNNNAFLLGKRGDVSKLLQAMDIFALPSIYEGFPVSLVEAQAAGVKCWVSKTVTKQVKLTDLVYFYDIKNKDEWVKALETAKVELREDTYKILESKKFEKKQIARQIEDLIINIE